MRGSCTSRPIKALAHLHAHRGKKLLQHLQTQESTTIKRAMVRFRGAREKGAVAFVEYLGVSEEETMEGPLRRETLGRSLWSHDAAELIGGTYHDIGCRQETTRIQAYSFVVGDAWPFRERASGQNGRLNPLRMDITTKARALDNHPRLKNKALLLDNTIVDLCGDSNLGSAARHADAVERRKTSIVARSRYLLSPSSRYVDLW